MSKSDRAAWAMFFGALAVCVGFATAVKMMELWSEYPLWANALVILVSMAISGYGMMQFQKAAEILTGERK